MDFFDPASLIKLIAEWQGLEWTAAAFGFLAVFFLVRQSIWCWPFGLTQVALYVGVYHNEKLYSDMILHIIYVGLQIYGWAHWLRHDDNQDVLAITRLTSNAVVVWIAVTIVGTGIWGYFMETRTDAALPYGDAFTTVASLIAFWLQARKVIETWLFWIVVDIVAIWIYLYKGLYPTTGLYVVFLILSIVGFLAWRTMTAEETNPNDDGWPNSAGNPA